MRKMLSANLTRLRRDKVFWIAVAAMFVFNLINVLSGVKLALRESSEFSYTLDHYCYGFLPMFGVVAAAFISLFQGTEYSDGTLRNKLIVGHTRGKLYLTNLLTNYIGAVIILMEGFLASVAGIPVLGGLKMETWTTVSYLVISLLMAGVLCALFTFIAMLTTNKAYSAVFCVLFWLGFTFLGSYFYNALSEPELNSGVLMTMNGMTMIEPTPNPAYIDGFQRQVYEFLADFFPSAQAIQMSNLEVAHPLRMVLCSVGVIIVAVVAGVFCFRKKDLK